MASILDMVQQQLGGAGINQISQQIGADPSATQSAIQMALPMLVGGLAHNTTQPGGAESLHTALDDHTGNLDGLSGLLGGAMGGNAMGGTGMGTGGLDALERNNPALNTNAFADPAFGGAPPASGFGGLGGMLGGGGGGMMGGGGLADMIGGALGGKLLGHILGQRRPQVEQGVSQQTGLDPQQVGRLLMILAPIVMGVLARRKQQQAMTPGQLGTELQQTHRQIEQQASQGGGLLGGLLGQVFGR